MIRELRADELDGCAELIRESFLTVAREFGITAQNAPRYTAFSVSRERLERQLLVERRPMLGRFLENRQIGFFSLKPSGEECELNDLCVLPAFRRRGVGAGLLLRSFSEARSLGCSLLRIGIVEENLALRRWYESFGFVHTGCERLDFFPFTCGYMKKDL